MGMGRDVGHPSRVSGGASPAEKAPAGPTAGSESSAAAFTQDFSSWPKEYLGESWGEALDQQTGTIWCNSLFLFKQCNYKNPFAVDFHIL